MKTDKPINADKPIPADFNIPYFIHQEDMYHLQIHAKRWFIGWIITFVALILSNVGWMIYESQYQDVVTTKQTVMQDAEEGGNNTFSGDFYGGDYNGETKGN